MRDLIKFVRENYRWEPFAAYWLGFGVCAVPALSGSPVAAVVLGVAGGWALAQLARR